MAGIKFNDTYPDAQEYLDNLLDQVEDLMMGSAVEFVKAAVAHNIVPVDTGMAKGTYLNVGAFLGVPVPIAPKSKKPKTYQPYKGAPKLPKTPQSGANLSDYLFERDGNKITFSFSTEVYHFILNDLSTGRTINSDAPWGSFEVGMTAFKEHFDAGFEHAIPDIEIIVGIS